MRTRNDQAFPVRKMVTAMTLAAVLPLAGCAVEPTPGVGGAAAPCGMGAVLVCELAPHADRCQCFRHSDMRDMMRALTRR